MINLEIVKVLLMFNVILQRIFLQCTFYFDHDIIMAKKNVKFTFIFSLFSYDKYFNINKLSRDIVKINSSIVLIITLTEYIRTVPLYNHSKILLF